MSKISELSDGGSLQSTDYLIAVRSGGNVKVRPNGAVSGTTGQFSTSLNVDGTVTADGLTVDGDATLQNTSDGFRTLNLSGNRSASGVTTARVSMQWDGNEIARIQSHGGTDTTNKDEGDLLFYTADAGVLKIRQTIDQNGDISFYEDTGTTPAFFWDASTERLGIGTTSPAYELDVSTSSGEAYIRVDSATDQDGGFRISENGTNKWLIYNDASANALSFYDNSNVQERMRIDSSGALLVGTTDSTIYDDATDADGHNLLANGQYFNSTVSEINMVLNRQNSDGDILQFRKDGTTVGGIGTVSGDIYIGQGDTNVVFNEGGDQIIPAGASGANRDAAVTLGASGVRFKDLYLSGGVYLGGTGAANKLDDYEEGTWTPTYELDTIDFSSVTYDIQTGKYTKIGNVVYCQVTLRTDAITVGLGSGIAVISGLPFTVSGGSYASAKPGRYASWAEAPGGVNCTIGTNYAYLIDEGSTAALTSAAFNTGANSNLIDLTFFYYT